jgi:GT2 family glycosyltransferase
LIEYNPKTFSESSSNISSKGNDVMPRMVAILIVSWNGQKDLSTCLESIHKSQPFYFHFDVFIVDNGSSDGTVEWLNDYYPWVQVIPLKENLGFAGGNNEGWKIIEKLNYKYLLLLNQDTEVKGNWLNAIVRAAEKDNSIAAIQPIILQMKNPTLVNTIGNPIHFLGFGYSGGNGRNIESIKFDNEIIDIPYASGACVLLRIELIRKIGLFDPLYFSYNEDLDLGWRILLSGYRNCLCISSRILHNYRYLKSGLKKNHWIERNRIIGILKNYHVVTILAYLPIFCGFEIFMIGHAAITGWFFLKMKGYGEIMRDIKQILHNRKRIQGFRRVNDGVILKRFTGVLEFDQEESMLVRIGNYIMNKYHSIIISIIFW